MISTQGKNYRRWTRKGNCPYCDVKTGSDHSPGCKYRDGLIAATQAKLYGIPLLESESVLDNQVVLVGEEVYAAEPYTLKRPIAIIDMDTNHIYGPTDLAIREIRVSPVGKDKFLVLLGEHGVVEHLTSMIERE